MAITSKRLFDPISLMAVSVGQSVAAYQKDRILFSQGDVADAVFYIQKGTAKVTVVSDQGREAVLGILGAKEFAGEACLAGELRRNVSVTTVTESVIVRLERGAAFRLIQERPEFASLLIRHLLSRAVRADEDLIDQLLNSSEKRLARRLLLLAGFEKPESGEPKSVKISQEMLAEMIGTTRSRVSFFMNKFRKLGLIDYKGDIRVHRSLSSIVQQIDPGDEGRERDVAVRSCAKGGTQQGRQ